MSLGFFILQSLSDTSDCEDYIKNTRGKIPSKQQQLFCFEIVITKHNLEKWPQPSPGLPGEAALSVPSAPFGVSGSALLQMCWCQREKGQSRSSSEHSAFCYNALEKDAKSKDGGRCCKRKENSSFAFSFPLP